MKDASRELLSEYDIRGLALQRVARIFNMSLSSISAEHEFGEELKSTFVSDFKLNEYNVIGSDVRDVADKKILKELDNGALVIRTVGGYCDHMVKCAVTRPKEVAAVLSGG